LTCRALHWHKPDGGSKDISARAAMLRMHADRLIVLPPPRGTRPDASVRISARSDPGEPPDTPAGALTPLVLLLQRCQLGLSGQTKGRGKLGPAGKQSLPIKDLWVYPWIDASARR
jgi:hypothetical protein